LQEAVKDISCRGNTDLCTGKRRLDVNCVVEAEKDELDRKIHRFITSP
jgi:hypothetical protein